MTTSGERLHYHFAEAPRGETLAAKTIETAAKAMEECYPSLKDKYSKRASINLCIAPFDLVQKERISDIPAQKTKAEEKFSQSKLLKTSIQDERAQEDEFLYWSTNPKDQMYVVKEGFFDELDSSEQKNRISTAILFGQLFISKTIQSLPMPQELHKEQKDYWKEKAIQHLHSFIEELKKPESIGIDPEKLDKLQMITEIHILRSREAQFFAYGAEVRILLPGQKIVYPSYTVGEPLNDGIAKILSEEAQLKFISLIKNWLFFRGVPRKKESSDKKFAKEILKNIKFEDRNSLFEAYVNSQIPLIAMDKYFC